jgi:hypothetical protein
LEILPVIRLVWRLRLHLAVGLVAAIAALVALGGTKPATSASALAWTRVALDTPRSQLVNSAPLGADTLTWRASLLTHLMTTDALQRALARQLGVPADQVAVVDPTLNVPAAPASMPTRAAEAASLTTAPNVVTVLVPNDVLPVISVEAAAADPAGAKRLAQAAVAVLRSQASAGGSFSSQIATGGKLLQLQPFLVEQVAPVRVKLVKATALPLKALGASLFLLVVWSAGVLLLPGAARRARGRRAALAA